MTVVRDQPRLSPRGTARERFAALGYDQTGTDRLGDFFARIADAVGIHDLDEDTLALAEELVRLSWAPSDDERQALALAVLASLISVRQGSSRLPLGGGVDGYLGRIVGSLRRAARLEVTTAAVLDRIDDLARSFTLDRIIGGPGEYRPLIAADGCLYQHRLLRCEDRLAARLRARVDAVAEPPTAEAEAEAAAAIEAVASEGVFPLSTEQRGALAHATRHRLTIITGGPGTGKTAIVVAILLVLRRLGITGDAMALAGPTGKAAHRMATAIRHGLTGLTAVEGAAFLLAGPTPQTLHRLLGYSPTSESFRHHETNPLRAEVLIIDEASMIDLDLMERLLAAVPATARLILLGDADQLPSIAAGAVLRDLVAALPDNTVRLTESFRVAAGDPAGAEVLALAAAVNHGHCPLPPAGVSGAGVSFVDTRSDPARAVEFVDRWCRERVLGDPDCARRRQKEYHFLDGALDPADRDDLDALFAHYERSRLLTITRRFAVGAEAVNSWVHQQLLAATTLEGQPDFLPGEPILMRRNDYERGLFNGDHGLVVRVVQDDGPQRFRAVFPRDEGYAVYPLDALRTHIELAFAMTVHKSQGSEFDHVAVLLPTIDLPLLTREMLYTAITRARHAVTLVGSEPLLRIAVSRTIERFSGVADKL